MPRAAQFLPDKESLATDKGVDLEVHQCPGCGLVQLSGGPVPYYREVIRAAGFSEEMKNFRMKQFSSFIQRYSLKGKKIIEIGCGRGEYLSILQQCGTEAYGLEHCEGAVKECVANGLKVFQGFIESSNYRINAAPFDAFYILSFLEHLPDPNSVLKGIYLNLTDEAVGIVEVPNFDMILRKKLFSEFIGDHLLYFTEKTLISTLGLNGFEIIQCNEEWQDYILSAVVRKRKKHDMSEFYGRQMKMKDEIENYINRYGNRNVAIWGAGHQALAIISLTNLGGSIKYVIDSAPFKQGKYTPATHVPIVSPDKLDSDPVDGVIVAAASYSDEVARIIRTKFDKKIDVSILRDSGLEEYH